MNFNKAHESLLCDAERDTVLRKLTILRNSNASGQRAVDNVQWESRLPKDVWDGLFRALLAASDKPEAVKQAIANFFCRVTLRGDLLPARPVRLGRARDFNKVVDWYIDVRHIDENRARQFFNTYFGRVPKERPRGWNDLPLAKYLMWCTFHPVNSTYDPFEGLASKAWDIRCQLGLSAPHNKTEKLVLFEYTLPDDIHIRFPTVADAYAGQEWAYHFQVAPEKSLTSPPPQHGWTLPWKECAEKPGLPEAVHEVVRGNCLTAPLRRVS
jgi:hypothetical protein